MNTMPHVPPRPMGARGSLVPVLALVVVALVGCTAANAPAAGSDVGVTLQEWAVVPDQRSVPAGPVTFNVTNAGPDDPHELVVIKTDLSPLSLPTDADGKVLEEGAGVEVIGEIEEMEPGAEGTATFDLEAGKYVLICNVLEKDADKTESHYKEGMLVPFTVD